MKFLNRTISDEEVIVFEKEGNESEKRIVNRIMISLAVIITTLLLGFLALTVFPNSGSHPTNQFSNTSANAKEPN